MYAETIREGIIIIESPKKRRRIRRKSLILECDEKRIVPMIAGFERKEGTYDNLWDWRTLESVEFKIK